MVEPQPSKLITRDRFPSPAPLTKSRALARLLVNPWGRYGNRTGSLSGIERSENEPLSKTVEALKNGTGVPF